MLDYELITEELDEFIEDEPDVKERLKLARNTKTSIDILTLLAFDKGHYKVLGDIRIAVAENSSTPVEVLEMIAVNADRANWGDMDWLDYENQHWDDSVEELWEYARDVATEIRESSKTAALNNLSNRN